MAPERGGARVKELEANLWKTPADLRCVTTSGYVTGKGACVMGRGCALEAKRMIPGVEYRLGRLICEHGNRPMRLCRFYDPEGRHHRAHDPPTHHTRHPRLRAASRNPRSRIRESAPRVAGRFPTPIMSYRRTPGGGAAIDGHQNAQLRPAFTRRLLKHNEPRLREHYRVHRRSAATTGVEWGDEIPHERGVEHSL